LEPDVEIRENVPKGQTLFGTPTNVFVKEIGILKRLRLNLVAVDIFPCSEARGFATHFKTEARLSRKVQARFWRLGMPTFVRYSTSPVLLAINVLKHGTARKKPPRAFAEQQKVRCW